MNAKEITEKIEAAGIACKVLNLTDGGAIVKFKVSQSGKSRDAEYKVSPDGTVVGSKYTYLLPNDLNSEIETV